MMAFARWTTGSGMKIIGHMRTAWKDVSGRRATKPVGEALSEVGLTVLAIDFDSTRCLVHVVIPEETSDEDLDRINRTAHAASSIGVNTTRPTIYPFSLHLQGPIRPLSPASIEDGVMEVRIQIEHLKALRSALMQLGALCAKADFVATFALGGLVPLMHIARFNHAAYISNKAKETALLKLQRKFHLFPGLLWAQDGTNEAVFKDWLKKLPSQARVIVFDTSFSGGSVGRARNAISSWANSNNTATVSRVDIVGIIDLSRLGKRTLIDSEEKLTTRAGDTIRLSTTYIRVPSLIAEDVCEIIGYDRLREIGQVEAMWRAATIILRNESGVVVSVIGARSLPAAFTELLNGRHRAEPLDGDMIKMSGASAVLMNISEAAREERDQLFRAFRAKLIDEATFIAERTRVKAELAGALKRYRQYFDDLSGYCTNPKKS